MYLKYFTTLMNRQACSLLAITLVAAQRRPQPRPPGRRRGPRVAYYCPSRPRPGSTPEYLYFTPFAENRFSDVHSERLLGRTGGVHLCKAGDPRVVDPARSIGDYRLKGELPTGYVSS